MSHFIAFYKCDICKEPIAGLVSNTMLLVFTALGGKNCLILNPYEIKVGIEVKTFCSRCAPSWASEIDLKYHTCQKEVKFFYDPPAVEVIKPNGERLLVDTKTLLSEYTNISHCSVACYRVRMRDENAEPIFLEFKTIEGGRQ